MANKINNNLTCLHLHYLFAGPQSDFSVANRLLPGPNQLHPHGTKRKVAWRHCPPTEHILTSASLSAPPPHYCVISTLPSAPLPFTNGSTAATHPACKSEATVPTNNHRTISPKPLGSKTLSKFTQMSNTSKANLHGLSRAARIYLVQT